MTMQKESVRNRRRPKVYLSSLNTNIIHVMNPWISAWWSAAFPGLGQIRMCRYLHGFILIAWEFLINIMAKVNLGILYSFTGRFELAKKVVNPKWVLLYVAVYIFGIYDSYRSTIDLNKFSVLSDREHSPYIPVKISNVAINYLDKSKPMVAAFWSLLMPGTGHLYINRPLSGFLILACWIVTAYYSNILLAVHFSFMGKFSEAIAVTDPQWLMFMPSLLGFAIYDSYTMATQYNKLFEVEQKRFLLDNYHSLYFQMPV